MTTTGCVTEICRIWWMPGMFSFATAYSSLQFSFRPPCDTQFAFLSNRAGRFKLMIACTPGIVCEANTLGRYGAKDPWGRYFWHPFRWNTRRFDPVPRVPYCREACVEGRFGFRIIPAMLRNLSSSKSYFTYRGNQFHLPANWSLSDCR